MKKYISFVKEHYIKENWDEFSKVGKIIIYPAWLIRSGIMIIIAIFGFPLCYLHMKWVKNEEKYEKMIVKKLSKFF